MRLNQNPPQSPPPIFCKYKKIDYLCDMGKEKLVTGRYLSPKADLTFKRIFGENKGLAISFLNSLLDFKDGAKIKSIEYQTPEMLPETPSKKYSIVDVKCRDDKGRQFIVEMQMVWHSDFLKRVLHNTTKSYSKQLEYGGAYENIMPVYTLCLLNENFTYTRLEAERESERLLAEYEKGKAGKSGRHSGKVLVPEEEADEFIHSYKMLDEKHPDHVIEGLNIVLVELLKFKPTSMLDKKMAVLWLRFLTEIDEKTRVVAPELLKEKEIKAALEIVERSAYTDEQMMAYERFWEEVSVALNFDEEYVLAKGRAEGLAEGEAIGMQKGEAIGMQKGEAIGMQKGEREANLRNAKKMKDKGFDIEDIVEVTGLSKEEIEKL